MYDVDAHVAEIYDQIETKTADVAQIRRLMAGEEGLRILEPFCGTGRILLPLAADGHTLVGMDRAATMLARARAKVDASGPEVASRVALLEADAVRDPWPGGFDVVVLGGNCLYELGKPEEQGRVIARAAAAVRAGGHLYVDNDHMEGELDASWYQPPVEHGVFPTGVCSDGTRLESSRRVLWYDESRRLIRFSRQTRVAFADGRVVEREVVQQKHPVSAVEVAGWLEDQGLTIERYLGDHQDRPYTPSAPRAIFWARR